MWNTRTPSWRRCGRSLLGSGPPGECHVLRAGCAERLEGTQRAGGGVGTPALEAVSFWNCFVSDLDAGRRGRQKTSLRRSSTRAPAGNRSDRGCPARGGLSGPRDRVAPVPCREAFFFFFFFFYFHSTDSHSMCVVTIHQQVTISIIKDMTPVSGIVVQECTIQTVPTTDTVETTMKATYINNTLL